MYRRHWIEEKLESGEELTEWEAKALFDGEVTSGLDRDAMEHQERRKRMPADVRRRDDEK